jgi:demethylmenaquinone methyltransferase/2-methoxy-6-polyprenyl-1,4-benzoquinol methylase
MPTNSPVVPYAGSSATKKEQVARMFDNISHSYDRLNRILSFGIDIWWRKKAINTLRDAKPETILDIATGTGDLAIEALSLKPEKIIGVDISEGMLSFGRKKLEAKGLNEKIELRLGDSEKLLFPEKHFDAVMVSFGVRNFQDLELGLTEIFRVLKPGGQLMVLEFSKPKNQIIKGLYGFYNRTFLPLIGNLLSKDSSAYTYLPESVEAFPEGSDFVKILTSIGFKKGKALPLTFGISSVYTGFK